MTIRPPTKSTLLIAFAVVFGYCAGATTMHAWQVRGTKAEITPVAFNNMWSVFQDLHSRAHLEHLPIQRLEDGSYN
jgi:hypothetical protein